MLVAYCSHILFGSYNNKDCMDVLQITKSEDGTYNRIDNLVYECKSIQDCFKKIRNCDVLCISTLNYILDKRQILLIRFARYLGKQIVYMSERGNFIGFDDTLLVTYGQSISSYGKVIINA